MLRLDEVMNCAAIALLGIGDEGLTALEIVESHLVDDTPLAMPLYEAVPMAVHTQLLVALIESNVEPKHYVPFIAAIRTQYSNYLK